MKGKNRRGGPGALVALAMFLAVFVWLSVFLGAGQDAPVQAVPLEGLPVNAQPILFQETESGVFLEAWSVRGTAFLQLDEKGRESARTSIPSTTSAAKPRGGSLFLLTEDGTVSQYSQGLQLLAQWQTPTPTVFLYPYDFSPAGDLYAGEGAVLTLYPRGGGGEAADREFEGEIRFLQVTPQGQLYVYAGGTLYHSGDGSFQRLSPVSGGKEPFALLGEEGWVDVSGGVYRLENGSPRLVTDLGLPPVVGTEPLYAGDEQGFAVGQNSGEITWYGWDGSVLGSCLVPTPLRAVTPSLALCGGDGALALAQTGFAAPAATPTPTPTPAPSEEPEETPTPAPSEEPEGTPTPAPSEEPEGTPTPAPSEEPEGTPSPAPSEEPEGTPSPAPSQEPGETPTPAPSEGPEEAPTPTPAPPPAGWAPELQGDKIYVPLGAAVEDLRNYFKPMAVKVLTPEGEAVYYGNLATGMTVEEYTIVVPGDCDGTGACNDRDVQAAQAHLLEETLLEGPCRLAADLDGDGEVTPEDLVLFDTLAPAS